MTKKTFLRDLIWIAPLSLGLGALLSALDVGAWWLGWLAYSFLLVLGLSALAALWRWAGAGRSLAWMLLLTLFLRLGLGIALTYILPVAGNPTDVQQAGYVFRDAFTRDGQAWDLARSTRPIWTAFDKSYSADQYGGLLALSALAYRYLSPDAQRPWLIVLLASLTATIGVALTWKVARQAWGAPVGALAAWIVALYPENILQGSSQMREPFLITFVAMTFWGVVDWQTNRNRRACRRWLAGGMAGMLLINPVVVVSVLVILAGWIWLQGGRLRFSWRAALASAAVAAAAILLLWLGLARGSFAGASLFETLGNWLRYSTKWDTYLIQRASDGLQPLFDALPQSLHVPLVTVYGLAQPVLPAAIVVPGVWPMQALGILRGLGWYALLPFLLYSLRPIWKMTEKRERLSWLWLWLAAWGWIVISSARAGGDQWDNPRYRVILLLFQAALAAKAWAWQRETRDPWLGHLLAVEGVSLLFFGYWYMARYTAWHVGAVSIVTIVMAIVVVSALILAGGWIWNRHYRRN